MPRQLFPVSVKAAIFNDQNELLMIFMSNRGDYGLPGGHIDAGEQPDKAMRRELAEETGVKGYTLKHVDFFLHPEGRVVLLYAGRTSDRTLKSGQNNIEGIPVWVSSADFANVTIQNEYKKAIIAQWPAF